MTRVCGTWNCDIRDNGTAFYVKEAFRALPGVEFIHHRPGTDAPPADFYLYVDDGQDWIEWIPPRPNCYWAIDTHLGYGYRQWKAKQFDRVYVAQKAALADLRRDGVKKVEWLPLACSPAHHPTAKELIAQGATPECLVQCWDLVFVGYIYHEYKEGQNDRVEYLDKLSQRFRNLWVSSDRFHQEMAARYVKGKIGFNVSIADDLNMRCFEIMSTRTPLLTNRDVVGIDDLFSEGVHYIGYKGVAEMIEQADKALRNEYDLMKIADAAYAEVRSKHTYAHRAKTILEGMTNAEN